uniref:Transcription factor E2F7 n=1 Tax=Ambystoma mexicanum TaxID=8296 RepID=A0A873A8H8_AMBME|nr:E2F transcription factor 7 [Ambystoma mexicanum]
MEVLSCLTLKDLASSRKLKTDGASDVKRAQKENIFIDRSRLTPLKNEPIDLSKQKGYTPESNPITPIKLADKQQPEPWTPTANLKMLISAASPDIRDREKKKELFRPIENNEMDNDASESMQLNAVDDGAGDDFEKRPSRKQKSLGLLCQKFLACYPSYPLSTEKTTISLDEVAASLGVERRRIYDIVNVLESLHLVSRVAKNQYCWHGLNGLNQTLQRLQCLGALQKYEEQIAHFQHKDGDMEYRSGDRKKTFRDYQSGHLFDFAEADGHSAAANSRKDKSLRIMSQKFVMLFLVSTTNIVTLDIAAKILIEESQDVSDQSKFKTKVRRLYDIANVLTSLGLIKKVHVTEERGRKPAFKWIGPVDFNTLCGDQRIPVTSTSAFPGIIRDMGPQSQTSVHGKQKLSRHASFNTVQLSEVVKRKASSEPNSPHRDRKACRESLDNYSTNMEHLAAACRLKIEEDSRSKMLPSDRRFNCAEALSTATPYSVTLPIPNESHYSLETIQQKTSAVAQSDTMSQLPMQNGRLGNAATTTMCSSAKAELNNPALFTNQSFVCLPSAPLFMLYGNLRDSSTAENHPDTGGCCNIGFDRRTPPERSPVTSSSSSPTSFEENVEPAAKIQKTDMHDAISLVIPKNPSKQMKSPQRDCCTPTERHCETGCYSPLFDEEKDLIKHFSFKDNDLAHRTEFARESMPSVPQYLYVPSACLNGFSLLLSANQTGGAVALSPSQLASLNVPCVMVPSSSLTQFPLLCSQSVTSEIPSALPASSANSGSMNFNALGMSSATHLLIGASSMVASKAPEPTSSDQHRIHSPLNENSGLSARTDSPVCSGQPVLARKVLESPTPQTPKNIRLPQHETFFKTPGTLGGPVTWRRSEGALARSSSTAQRRLQISGSGSE